MSSETHFTESGTSPPGERVLSDAAREYLAKMQSRNERLARLALSREARRATYHRPAELETYGAWLLRTIDDIRREKRRAQWRRYGQSPKGRARYSKYNASENGKERVEHYRGTSKGMKATWRSQANQRVAYLKGRLAELDAQMAAMGIDTSRFDHLIKQRAVTAPLTS